MMLLVTPSISPSLSLSAILSFISCLFWTWALSGRGADLIREWAAWIGGICVASTLALLTQCFRRQSIMQRCPSRSAQALLTTTHTIQSSMSGNGLLDGVYRLKTSSLSWKPYHLQASCPRAACPLLVWERSEYTLFLTNSASLLRLPTPAVSINPPHKKKQ